MTDLNPEDEFDISQMLWDAAPAVRQGVMSSPAMPPALPLAPQYPSIEALTGGTVTENTMPSPALPLISQNPSIEALTGGTVTEDAMQLPIAATPQINTGIDPRTGWTGVYYPTGPNDPYAQQLASGVSGLPQMPTQQSPLQVAQGRLGALYDRTAMADKLASEQARVRQELLGAYTPKKIGWQNALLTSLAGLAPALVASAVLQGDEYGALIGKAGSEGLTAAGNLYNNYLANEQKGELAAAQFDLNNLEQLQGQSQALDKVALQGEYDLAVQEARSRLGGGFGQNIISDINEARRVANLTGYQGDPADLVGSTEKLVMDRVNRDVRTENQQEQLEARHGSLELAKDKFQNELGRASIFGTVKVSPDAPPLTTSEASKIKVKVADTIDLNQKFDRFGELLAKHGPSIAGPQSAEMQALQSAIMNKYRALTNSGATLTAEESRWLQYLTPIAASADPKLALQRAILGQDGPQFLKSMKDMNTMAIRSTLAGYGLDLDEGQLPQVGKNTKLSGDSQGVLTPEQRTRLAQLRAKYGR